jgi:hypothetical protein
LNEERGESGPKGKKRERRAEEENFGPDQKKKGLNLFSFVN